MNKPNSALKNEITAGDARDQMFLSLINDLAQDIIEDAQTAAEQTIDLSSQFLDTESQRLVENFQALCGKGNFGDEAQSSQDESSGSHVDIVQAGFQDAITKDIAVRAEINTILSAMQFSELLRQHLVGLCATYEILINESETKADDLKQNMLESLHTFDERKAYYTEVLHQDMPNEDAEIDQDLIDQLLGNNNA